MQTVFTRGSQGQRHRERQRIRIEASSGLNDDEIKRMREEARANSEADNKLRKSG